MGFKFRSEPSPASCHYTSDQKCSLEAYIAWSPMPHDTVKLQDYSRGNLFRHIFRACGTSGLHSRAFCGTCTSQMDVESEAPAPLESSKPETGRHWHQRWLGITRRKLTWGDWQVSGSYGWHFQTKVNLKVISAPPTASVTQLCPFPDKCFSLLWSAVCMAHRQDSTLSDQRWDWKRVFWELVVKSPAD